MHVYFIPLRHSNDMAMADIDVHVLYKYRSLRKEIPHKFIILTFSDNLYVLLARWVEKGISILDEEFKYVQGKFLEGHGSSSLQFKMLQSIYTC